MAKSLVLVVGAGASKEVNLPIGAELRSRIACALDIRYEDGYRRSSGDGTIDDAFREIVRERSPLHVDINPFLHCSWRIRDAMPQAISIDNFIDSHRDDERITTCGKLAIARCILAAEAESSLFVNSRDRYPKIDFAAVEPTWFNSFFQLLTENCQAADIDERLSKISIITFNYDRCIEHYLYGALQNYYGITPDRSAEALANLEIFHPYGSVGPLPWQRRSGGIEYGATVGGRTLIEATKGIRTFTEGIDPATSDVESIRATLRAANRLAFLGFSFHRLNVALLFPGLADGEQVVSRPAFATGFGISRADCQEIALELSRLGAVFSDRFQIRNDLVCAGLFREYWRSLGLAS
ncbi:hypothetical protein [Methyloversatilis sp.]|uniref:hypothetical protein n=1 Tax=Methyloversatilis sp. TaxID=2569862 RepID=UPI003F70724E